MKLTAKDPDTGLVRVVVDTPAGSRNKYKFDPELGVFKISRILPVLVGSIETPVNAARLRELSDVSRETLREIEHFFRSYNEAQGRPFQITGRGGAKAAESILEKALMA